MDYEPLENQLVKVPVEPIIVQEDFHFAKEIIPDQIYNFNIGEQHFRQLLRKQRGDHKVIVVDHYHLYHYVVCVDSDRKKWTYSEEVVSEESDEKRKVVVTRAKRIKDIKDKKAALAALQDRQPRWRLCYQSFLCLIVP